MLSFICFNSTITSQIIKGTVLEKNTKSAIPHAVVYFNGTSSGTYTDQNGLFTLDISKFNSMPLTISALGYYSVTLNEFPTDKPLLIYLPLKVFALNEVNISAKHDAKSREKNLNIFKKILLGTTQNALKCEIINENDIMLFHKEDTLKAYSSKPILINNKALGYKISFYLDKFELIEKNGIYQFIGNVIFNEDMSTYNKQKQIFEKRRKTYLGSKMHFFRSLWENKLSSEGFLVFTQTNVLLNYNEIVIQEDKPLSEVSIKYLKYPGRIGISYLLKFPESFINFEKDSVFFQRNGYFDGLGIIWEGKMEGLRIADMLPYEYF